MIVGCKYNGINYCLHFSTLGEDGAKLLMDPKISQNYLKSLRIWALHSL